MILKPRFTQSYLFVIVAFLLLAAPMALDFNFYYPDEVHYTDAAIEMLHSGDILTPYQGSGELRFNKPIVTYWIVLLCFKLFGISAFSARFLFLIAGGGVLALIYHTSKLIYTEKKIALLATLITASNVTFLMSCMRSIPDIILCLFIALSLTGFAGFLRFGNNTPKKYHWMLFLGIAIAFEVKGIPAVIIGAMAFLFLLINPWNKIKLKTMLHWPSLLVSVVVGLFWFIIMYFFYKELFVESFYGDQVGERVSRSIIEIIGNLGLSLGLMIGLLIPWLTFFPTKRSAIKPKNKIEKAFHFFAIISILTFLVLSGTVFKFYDRYLLPLVPIWSVWVGFIISKNIDKKKKLMNFWGVLATIVHLILLGFALIISITLDENLTHYIWLLSGIAISYLILYQLFRTKKPLWLALTIPLIAYNLTIITHTISFPGEGQQIAHILKNKNVANCETIGFVGNKELASKLRIAGKGKYNITNISNMYAEYESENYNTLIVSQQDMYLFPEEMFDMIGNSVSWSSYESSELITSLFKGNYRSELAYRGKKYFVLKRK